MTNQLPIVDNLPRHVAIIMDGNNRWAAQKNMSGVSGHKAGAEAVQAIVEVAQHYGIPALTLFAFSSENWKRPKAEVKALLDIFSYALKRETSKAQERNICLKVIGDLDAFPKDLQNQIVHAEVQTQHNTGLRINVAANYGGRWDITQATKKIAEQVQQGHLEPSQITQEKLSQYICLNELPDVDLCIRTSGEKRLSNFLLWQLSYAELFFIDTYWPDFKHEAFIKALLEFNQRHRRFGQSTSQLAQRNSGSRPAG